MNISDEFCVGNMMQFIQTGNISIGLINRNDFYIWCEIPNDIHNFLRYFVIECMMRWDAYSFRMFHLSLEIRLSHFNIERFCFLWPGNNDTFIATAPVITQTGLPCNFGFLARSQDMKKQSQSIKAIIL